LDLSKLIPNNNDVPYALKRASFDDSGRPRLQRTIGVKGISGETNTNIVSKRVITTVLEDGEPTQPDNEYQEVSAPPKSVKMLPIPKARLGAQRSPRNPPETNEKKSHVDEKPKVDPSQTTTEHPIETTHKEEPPKAIEPQAPLKEEPKEELKVDDKQKVEPTQKTETTTEQPIETTHKAESSKVNELQTEKKPNQT